MTLRSIFLLSFAMLAAALAPAAETVPLDLVADLTYLHKEVIDDPAFQQWRAARGANAIGRWRETLPAGGFQYVIVQQSGPETSSDVFLMRVKIQPDGTKVPAGVAQLAATTVSSTYDAAVSRLASSLGITSIKPAESMLSANPSVPSGPDALLWVLTTAGTSRRIFNVQPAIAGIAAVAPIALPTPPLAHACTPGVDDALSSNELHHPTDRAILDYVLSVVADPRDVHDSARRLCAAVHHDIAWGTPALADVFTDNDLRTREYGVGACDEKAVLLVTYLRAIGIPARVKFLRWKHPDGKELAHACAEYEAKGVAYHIDPTRNIVDRPETYREVEVDGAVPDHIHVVDVDWPDDSRLSDNISAQIPDRPGDGRLNPWGDFCYSPTADGEERARYSK